MNSDNWFFGVIPITVGVTIGAIIGGWLGSFLGFTVLGVVVGGLLGVICALLLSIKAYAWALNDLEEEWKQERIKREQARKKDDL
jgi:uncharacterized membrane protein YfcA